MSDKYKEYQVGMSWDSCQGSLFRETNTTWVWAFSENGARQKASASFGHNKGFQIEYVT